MKHKKAREDGEHEVTINITIAKASFNKPENYVEGKKGDLPQVQNYFHCQYKLLPDDKDVVKTDVVTFGGAAKMYGDNDSKVLRTWLDRNKIWVAWTNSRIVRVTQDVLLKMFAHNLELKMWDTKDKVSAKARFDRPKAFRLPQAKTNDEVDLDTIRKMIVHDGKINIYLGTGSISLLKKDQEKENKAAKKVGFVNSNQDLVSEDSSLHFITTNDSKLEVKVRLDENKEPGFKNLLSLASAGEKPLVVDTEEIDKIQAPLSPPKRDLKPISPERERKVSPTSKSRTQSRKLLPSSIAAPTIDNSAEINQNGLASITVPLSSLFTNCLSVSNTLPQPISGLDEVIVIVTLDKPLLSDHQRHNLNPLILTVLSASPMPNNSMSYEEMKSRCLPPYIKYKFHDCPEHKSGVPKEHGKSIKFNDRNVFLLGNMNKSSLYEYLRGPTLKIEVHDRDPKKCPKKKPSVFGSEPDDGAIFNAAYAGGDFRNILSNNEMDINYGIADFDLSELLFGGKYIHMISPIRKYKNSYDNGNVHLLSQGNAMGIPAGEYLENGSELKIEIELARSLRGTLNKNVQSPIQDENIIQSSISSASTQEPECPYSRIVYIFDYNNKVFLGNILSLTTDINAKALHLSTYPIHVIEVALSTYKLSDEEKEDKLLDIITGCQIIDGAYHIFILEGLTSGGVQRLWDTLGHPQPHEKSFFRVLYNSNMAFSKRLYISLEVDLTRIRLHEPLSNIVKQPLLYVRDMISKNCFNAVTKLFQLCQCSSLHTAVRNEFLPTVPMIVSVGREFGVPLTRDDVHDASVQSLAIPSDLNQIQSATDSNVTAETSDSNNSNNVIGKNNNAVGKKERQTLDMTNESFRKIIADRKNGTVIEKNYINANVKSLLEFSKEQRSVKPTVSCDTIEVAHNYSTQALNSTMMAYQKMREILSEDRVGRYTFCQKYNSATMVPVSNDKEGKMKETLSKKKWRRKEDFIFPGFKSSTEANQHHKKIHSSRLEELYKPWRENILHANKLKPSVDRLLFKWVDRNQDFDVWKKPSKFFDQSASAVTVHAAGDTLKKEEREWRDRNERIWKEKIVVDDPLFKTHRHLIATELTLKGAKASNQIDKMDGLLKDEPKKYSIKSRGMSLQPITALSVVSYPSVEKDRVNVVAADTELQNDIENMDVGTGFHPGCHIDRSWSRDINCVPIPDYEHGRFENLKGHDFRLVHTDRETIGKKIKPLTLEEKNTHLFFTKN